MRIVIAAALTGHLSGSALATESKELKLPGPPPPEVHMPGWRENLTIQLGPNVSVGPSGVTVGPVHATPAGVGGNMPQGTPVPPHNPSHNPPAPAPGVSLKANLPSGPKAGQAGGGGGGFQSTAGRPRFWGPGGPI